MYTNANKMINRVASNKNKNTFFSKPARNCKSFMSVVIYA